MRNEEKIGATYSCNFDSLPLSLWERTHTETSLTRTRPNGEEETEAIVSGERGGEKKKKKKKKEKDLAERIREEVGEETVYLLSEGKV